MQRGKGFTLIEIAISVFILALLLLLALPSVSGVLADRRLTRSLDAMNDIVRMAQAHSVQERRTYVREWQKRPIRRHPRAPKEDHPDPPPATLPLAEGDAYILRLPAALEKGPVAKWVFSPSGTCEPAVVRFKDPEGAWQVNY